MDQKDSPLPLNALRVYVAIVRELSITKAAKTIGSTQSSVSRHLAVLEQYVGDKLVERVDRNIRLTKLGYVLAESVTEPLEMVTFSVNRMRRRYTRERRITVRTSLPTLTSLFIVPRLPDFFGNMG
ncbi:glycine cleavage system transcriptional activator [Antarctobacter heliothermus]|uniref:Glycine cleavage system transcriptional activator n=1 Tax=Antarctobacter heliothermus TaxID=74033 RepID=A0A222E328_9RHOB|nr:LysR family transcriptional regulator [Antarctobacter heliothermus]ASP20619.1 glycine cleavage system transcriptional activator [Antarctobacter heliothermus]